MAESADSGNLGLAMSSPPSHHVRVGSRLDLPLSRPRRLASSTHVSTMEIDGTLDFDPVPDGTRMRWAWDLRPRGVLRLLSPLVARIGHRQEQVAWTNLKRLLEAQQVARTSTGSAR
jgi:hypothetical protein